MGAERRVTLIGYCAPGQQAIMAPWVREYPWPILYLAACVHADCCVTRRVELLSGLPPKECEWGLLFGGALHPSCGIMGCVGF